MKRSQINKLIKDALVFIDEYKFALPPFFKWTFEEWKTKTKEYQEIKDNMLGWDITDFGSGDFENVGLLLLTIRNGNIHDPKYKKTYAEKLLIAQEGQSAPYHYHKSKMEDIINRGGGMLALSCYNSGKNGEMLETPVAVYSDGREYTVAAGETIMLSPGESLTLPQGQYHKLWAVGGPVLIAEVSAVNDDNADNFFLENADRFPEIEEDEPILYPLVTDYPEFI